jgi:hypothetical protein
MVMMTLTDTLGGLIFLENPINSAILGLDNDALISGFKVGKVLL